MQYTSARLIARAKEIRDDEFIIEVVVRQLDEPLAPCRHPCKYRLFFGTAHECRVRDGNERGKGDHRHAENGETAYAFTDQETLLADFEQDVTNWSRT